jgi:glycosyltransferase involved in cell wall biosynthesis
VAAKTWRNPSYHQLYAALAFFQTAKIFAATAGALVFQAGYDLVISSSGAEAKSVKAKPPAVHINYCHAPTHYYWSRYEQYLEKPGFGRLDPLARLGLKLLVGPMRRWDYRAAQRPAHMIANSNFTKEQIKKYYGRDSIVVHPPVETERFEILNKSSNSRQGFLTAGRQTPYKRIDLAVAACTELGLPLTVIGDGPEHKKLVKMAGPSVKFLAGLSDREVVRHFQSAGAFIFPGLDDFGIVAVEALAAGTPVIAYHAGGALDYVKPGETGEFFAKQALEDLADTLQKFRPDKYNPAKVQAAAAQFSAKTFREKMLKYINQEVN